MNARALLATRRRDELVKLGPRKPAAGTKIVAQGQYASGLVGCWLFNEGSGTKVYDCSGKNNHGTISNTTVPSGPPYWITTGAFGNALSFPANGNPCVSVPHNASLSTNTALTVVAWINSLTNSSCIASKGNANYPSPFDMQINAGGSRRLLMGQTSNYCQSDSSGTPMSYNTLQQVAVTALYSSTPNYTISHYLQGAANGSATTASPALTSQAVDAGQPFLIGTRPDNYTYFYGTYEMIRVYNRALSAAEIAYLYANPFAGLYRSV